MNYHNITTDDMLNGDGLRTVLWTAGCGHHCSECQNPQTWDPNGGIPFDKEAEEELFGYLKNSYISGITFSGGDSLHENNVSEIYRLIQKIKFELPEKTIWLYSGFKYEEIRDGKTYGGKEDEVEEIADLRKKIINACDFFVDGRYEKEKRNVNKPWAGSDNQRIINMKETKGETIVEWEK